MNPLAHPGFIASLIEARRTGATVARDAAIAPADLAAAFAVQDAVATELGEAIAGWKVGFAPTGEAVAAPLYASTIHPSGARWPLPVQGTMIIELEIAFRLARDLPPRPRSPYRREEILAAVGEALVGIEVIKGRVGEAKDVSYPVFLADNIGNLGYVTGEASHAFATLDLPALRCRLRIDDKVVHDAAGGHPQGDPVEPLRAWASAPRDGLGGLRAGHIVTTGSLTGVTRLHRPATISGDVEGIGTVFMTCG